MLGAPNLVADATSLADGGPPRASSRAASGRPHGQAACSAVGHSAGRAHASSATVRGGGGTEATRSARRRGSSARKARASAWASRRSWRRSSRVAPWQIGERRQDLLWRVGGRLRDAAAEVRADAGALILDVEAARDRVNLAWRRSARRAERSVRSRALPAVGKSWGSELPPEAVSSGDPSVALAQSVQCSSGFSSSSLTWPC